MSESERDVERLAEALHDALPIYKTECLAVAQRILASDWLTERDAAIRDEALAQPHDCEGQRQLGRLARVTAQDPPPDVVERIKAEALAKVRARIEGLHPKIENPTHGCCAPPKLCKGHPPECGSKDHSRLSRPAWPCATLRALLDGGDQS